MTEVLVATTTGKEAVLKEAVVEGFRSSFYGGLLLAEDQDYGEVRALWNGMIGQKPALHWSRRRDDRRALRPRARPGGLGAGRWTLCCGPLPHRRRYDD